MDTISPLKSLLIMFFLIMNGCSKDTHSPINNTKLTINPAQLQLPLNATYSYKALSTDSNGLVSDVTHQVSWSSTVKSIATVDNNGLVSTHNEGSTEIIATLSDQTASSSLHIIDWDTIKILPSTLTISAGLSAEIYAFTMNHAGESADITSVSEWQIEDNTIASIKASTSRGYQVLGLKEGKTSLSANYNGKSVSVPVIVDNAQPMSLNIEPNQITLPIGLPKDFSAFIHYSDNSVHNITDTVNWVSDTPTIVAFDTSTDNIQPGRAYGIAPGLAKIFADYNGLTSNPASIHVIKSQVIQLITFPQMMKLNKGMTVLAQAEAKLSNNTSIDITRQATWSVKDSDIATVVSAGNHAGNVTGLKTGTTQITASFNNREDSIDIIVSDPSILSLTIESDNLTYPIGSEIQYRAKIILSDGTDEDVTTKTQWSSSHSHIDIFPTGIHAGKATAISAGSSKIIADYQDMQSSVETIVSPATLSGLIVEPANLKLPIAVDQQYVATGIYSDHSKREITQEVNWYLNSASNSIANIHQDGLLTTTSAGEAEVFASLDTLKNSTHLSVIEEQLVSIYIEPPKNTEYINGMSDQLTAYGTYRSLDNLNTHIITDKVDWSSSKPGVISINNTNEKGLIQANASGHTYITIHHEDKSDTLQLFVRSPVLEDIILSPISPTIHTGETLTFTAQGQYSDNNFLDISRQVTWESLHPSIASINQWGTVIPLSQGATEIRATDPYSLKTASTHLMVTQAPIKELVILPNEMQMGVGVSKQLIAKAIFSDGSEKNVSVEAAWVSENEQIASVENNGDESGTVTGQKVGVTTISAGFEGKIAKTTARTIKHEIDHITIEPKSLLSPQGIYTQYHATAIYTDKEKEDITHNTNWSATSNPIVTINNKGLVLTEMLGSTDIIANFQNQEARTTLTVIDTSLVHLKVRPEASDLHLMTGQSYHLKAPGLFSNNQTIDMTSNVTWVSSQPEILSIASYGKHAGLATAHKAGTATITAYNHYANKTATETYQILDSQLDSIHIEPVNPSIPLNNMMQLNAIAHYKNNEQKDVTAESFWQSENSPVADISQEGQVIAKNMGSSTIIASFQGKQASTLLNVIDGKEIKEIIISPNPATMQPVSELWFSAKAIFYDGTELDITKTGTWRSSNPWIATIGNTIFMHGRAWAGGAKGECDIIIEYRNRESKAKLTVDR